MRKNIRIPALALAGALALTTLTACANDAASSGGSAGSDDAAGSGTTAGSGAPAGKATKVKIMVGGLDKVIYMPAMLSQRLGYFKAEGLDVTLLSEPAGVDATTALVAGQVQGAVGFYDHTLDLQTKGKHVESVVQFSQAPGEVEVVSTKAAGDIASAKDFKGKHLGITGLGSSTDFLTKYLAVQGGLKVSDITPVAVGAGATFIAALQHGSIQAGMTTDPTVAQILDKGAGKVLYDMRTPDGSRQALGGLYPSSSLYMNTAWVNGHKDTVQKLANAFVKTLNWMSTHTPEEIAAKMPADYAQGGAQLYAASIKATLPMFTADGVMPADGPATVERVLKAFNPNLRNATVDLGQTYTTEFVKNVR
ncbi:ABC transporter substrate-binding protein [Actinacidiphila paucisporea]|uniref:NitT/TauT family transport system substrate-binding protein n=1 Tax=Actinacidiphila paucisporea TaxID=310782 RepID=A0A1M7PR17_9ACTN|nr:ABC transporter substrate-binding protein [Actinacidiphila paucisporea]SHN19788.1 NitT/TauT family transport system substrate-binding protein [Actinacidiphila paucisporea]